MTTMRSARAAVVSLCATTSVDRKSTRLNSSHSQISYAVFCLKKKKIIENARPRPINDALVMGDNVLIRLALLDKLHQFVDVQWLRDIPSDAHSHALVHTMRHC